MGYKMDFVIQLIVWLFFAVLAFVVIVVVGTILRMIFSKSYREKIQKESQDLQTYQQKLNDICQSTVIKATDLQDLKKWREEQGLSDIQARIYAKKAYQTACKAVIDRATFSPESKAGLQRLRFFLDVNPVDFPEETKELDRLSRHYQIEHGDLPTVHSSLITKLHETVHYSLQSALLEERVVSREYRGLSNGVGLRVSENLGVTLGGHGGELVDQTGVVAADTGELLISNQRAVFLGEMQSFEVNYRDLLSWSLAYRTLTLHTKHGTKVVQIIDEQFDSYEILMALSRLIDIDLLS